MDPIERLFRFGGRSTIEYVIDITLLTLLVIIALTIVRLRSLIAVIMLFSIYSLLTAALFVVLDAVDVAFTEAAVGAGVTTVLALATLVFTVPREKIPVYSPILPLVIVAVTGGALIYGTLDMPNFGDPGAPAHHHVAPRYIRDAPAETGIPNIVTSVLASYRGYDTLGEVAVIFAAGIGVLLLIGGRRRRPAQGAGK